MAGQVRAAGSKHTIENREHTESIAQTQYIYRHTKRTWHEARRELCASDNQIKCKPIEIDSNMVHMGILIKSKNSHRPHWYFNFRTCFNAIVVHRRRCRRCCRLPLFRVHSSSMARFSCVEHFRQRRIRMKPPNQLNIDLFNVTLWPVNTDV